MKINKFNENKEIKTAEMLVEMFFEESDNFEYSNQRLNVVNNNNVWYFRLIFAFGFIGSLEFEQITKCKDYIQDLDNFYMISSNKIEVYFELSSSQLKALNEKLELYMSTNKYNI